MCKKSRYLLCSVLLLCITAAIFFLALLPVTHSRQQSGQRLSIADAYHAGIGSQLALVQLSDVTAAEPSTAPATLPATELTVFEPMQAETVPAPSAIKPTAKAPAIKPVSYRSVPDPVAAAEPTLPEAAEPIKKHYSIPQTAAAAPVPNTACFGEATSAADMTAVLQRAAQVLEGQQMFFSPDIEIQPGSKIYYYLDDTIFSVVWKQEIDRAIFTYAETKVMDASQFRRHLSGGGFGSGKLALTSDMSKSVNAVVGCSADYYSYRYEGITIVDGVVQKIKNGVKDNCFVDSQGNLILEQDRVFADKEALQQYVEEHDICFSLSFGPVLVKDGVFSCPRDYRLGQVYGQFPRAAICQMGPLHYLYMVSNAEKATGANRMLTMAQFAEYVAEIGRAHV